MCKRYSGKEGILKIDFKHARGVFEDYLNGYDREDEKIKLKIIHTYGVVKSAREIGHRMHLNEEDQQLAELIALLHDIGRFQQLRLYNSFSPDTMDHAAFGVQLLFEGENPMISRFIEDRSYDEFIRVAIARHSDFRLEGIQDERTLSTQNDPRCRQAGQLQSEAGGFCGGYDRCPSGACRRRQNISKGMGILPEKRGSFIS